MRYFIYLTLIVIGKSEVKSEIQPLDPCKFDVITDFSAADCEEGTFYYSNGSETSKHSCFPTCIEIKEIKDKLWIEDYECSDAVITDIPCPPGYLCKEKRCKIDPDSCFKYHSTIEDKNNKWNDLNGTYKWKPECLPDGTWAPKQCKGESSSRRCFCYDSFGKRLFGQEFFHENSTMTCACSRKKLELANKGPYFYSTLHCDANGNYEDLQCNEGNCWCVKPTTGEIISEIVPESMMLFLRCHHLWIIGEQYLRKCESEKYAQAMTLYKLGIHGTKKVEFEHLLCDADGSYGSFKLNNRIVTCKWRDNSDLNAGGSSISETLLNCNCVRDVKIFANAGIGHGKLCLSDTGAYNPVQQLSNGTYYCVDTDGYRISDYINNSTDCTEYNY